MKFSSSQTLKQIAEIINVNYIGTDDFPIFGMNEIHVVSKGDIVFVDHPKYYKKALESAATIILINKEVECPEGKEKALCSETPSTKCRFAIPSNTLEGRKWSLKTMRLKNCVTMPETTMPINPAIA